MDTPSGIATLMLFSLCFFDVLKTSLIRSHGVYEMNPVMVPIVRMPLLHTLLKWGVVAFIAGVAAVADRMVSRAGILILGVIILWYMVVVMITSWSCCDFPCTNNEKCRKNRNDCIPAGKKSP
jgi:hypothetical protein